MPRGFQAQLLAPLLALLLGVQVITLLVVQDATRARLAAQSGEALAAISVSFGHWLRDTVRRLADSSAVLAQDFGFRSAIASGDVPTIATAIENARRRIAADVALVINLDGEVIASAGAGPDATAFTYPSLLRDAEASGRAASVILLDGRLMEFVLVPVATPDVVAWIGIGIEVGGDTAKVLREQSAVPVDVGFALEQDGRWRLHGQASTAPRMAAADAARAATLACQDEGSAHTSAELSLAGGTYVIAGRMLATARGAPRACMVVHRSLDAALAPYQPLFKSLWVFCLAAGVAGALVASVIARKVTRPIRRLAQAAEVVQGGQYPEAVAVSGPTEITRLADTFNSMIGGLAEREQQIFRQANFDPLTGLPNRGRFEHMVDQVVAEQGTALLLLLHVHNLREVSNTLGHEFGDRAIAGCGRRIANAVKHDDVLARFDADKFALLLHSAAAADGAGIVRRLLELFDTPLVVTDVNVDIGLRIGLAQCPQHGADHRALLRKAEVALDDARQQHRPHAIYDPANDPYKAERLSLIGELRDSMDDGSLSLHYQPKIALDSGRITQAEALMRWQSPSRGWVAPDEFILLAERTGFISRLTRWALTRAAADCRHWRDQGRAIKVSINVSTRDLLDPALPSQVLAALAAHGLTTDALAIEVTESGIMEQPALALKSLAELTAAGVDIAIDDFGTGHSSMAYIGDMSAQELKIDKRFVLDLARNPKSQTIVRTMIQLGHSFGMRVCAEGVEDALTIELLRSYGCDHLQGWYFSKALPAPAFGALLDEWRGRSCVPVTANVRSLRA